MYAFITDHEERMGSNGQPFWQVRLRTEEGDIKGMMWRCVKPFKNPEYPQKGELIKLTEFEDRREAHGNIVVKKFLLLKKEDLPPEVATALLPFKASIAQLQDAQATIFNKTLYQNPLHYEFVRFCFGLISADVLTACPAAKKIHHAYQGGLLVHTAELVKICKGLVSSFPYPELIDSDIIYAGASLHDIGKVETYGTSEFGVPFKDVTEDSIGHIFHSMNLISTTANAVEVEKSFVQELLHVVASHHGEVAHGAIKPPMTLEAHMVAHADFLSSRCGIIHSKFAELKSADASLNGELEIGRGQYDKFITTTAMRRAFDG